jgi:hypothetical protein
MDKSSLDKEFVMAYEAEKDRRLPNVIGAEDLADLTHYAVTSGNREILQELDELEGVVLNS